MLEHKVLEYFGNNIVMSLVTRTKPYCFPTVYQRLISVDFQLLISNHWNPTEITLEKTFIQPLKNPTFQTENQPFWNVGNTFFNSCCVTRGIEPVHGAYLLQVQERPPSGKRKCILCEYHRWLLIMLIISLNVTFHSGYNYMVNMA